MLKFPVLKKDLNESKEDMNRKLQEEVGEVLMAEDGLDRMEEIFDVMQVCVGELVKYKKRGLPIKEIFEKHRLKLIQRGWEIESEVTVEGLENN